MPSNGSLALFLAAAINTLLPGPCALMIVGRTLRAGLAGGAMVAAGAFLADVALVFGALALIVGAIALSPDTLVVMRWVGVAVLVGMGIKTFPGRATPKEAARAHKGDALAGFAVSLASPYNLVFYLALVPHAFGGAPNTAAAVSTAATAVLTGVAAGLVALVCAARLLERRRWSGGRGLDYASSLALFGFAAAAAIGTIEPPRWEEAGTPRTAAPAVALNAR